MPSGSGQVRPALAPNPGNKATPVRGGETGVAVRSGPGGAEPVPSPMKAYV